MGKRIKLVISIMLLLGLFLPVNKVDAMGLLNIGIFETEELEVNYSPQDKELTLVFTGRGLKIGLLKEQNIIFELPPEIIKNIDNSRPIEGSYNRSLQKINFQKHSEINTWIIGSIVSVLDLSIGLTPQKFTLKVPVIHMPPPEREVEEYVFRAEVTDQGIIDLNILSLSGTSAPTDTIAIPPRPVVNEVSDVRREVSGHAPEAEKVFFVEQDTQEWFEAAVDETTEEFTYQLEKPFKAGTQLVFVSQNAEGGVSAKQEVTVEGRILSLSAPEKLVFETTTIVNKNLLVYRKDPQWHLKVRDTRNAGAGWKVKARIKEETESSLSQYVVFVDKNGSHTPFSDEALLVAEGRKETHEETLIHWEEDEGILLYMNPMQAGVEPHVPYTTTIEWTIENVP